MVSGSYDMPRALSHGIGLSKKTILTPPVGPQPTEAVAHDDLPELVLPPAQAAAPHLETPTWQDLKTSPRMPRFVVRAAAGLLLLGLDLLVVWTSVALAFMLGLTFWFTAKGGHFIATLKQSAKLMLIVQNLTALEVVVASGVLYGIYWVFMRLIVGTTIGGQVRAEFFRSVS